MPDRTECYWYGRCGVSCEGCEDYDPVDETAREIETYFTVLRENAEEYQTVAEDYSDRSDRDEG
jgi:hypothetical protein